MKKKMTVALILLLLLLAGCRMSGGKDIRYSKMSPEEEEILNAANARVEEFQLSEGDYLVEVSYYENSEEDMWTEPILSMPVSAAGEEGLPLYVSWTREPGSGPAGPVAWSLSAGGQKVQSGYYPEKMPEGLAAQMTSVQQEDFDLKAGMEVVLAAVGCAENEMPSWEAFDWGGMSDAEQTEALKSYGAVWMATIQRQTVQE